jgi:tetratricopeptide (TPR) repeat protein
MRKNKPKYGSEFKQEVCETALSQTIRKAADLYGVNKETVVRWIKEHTKEKITEANTSDIAKTDEGILYVFFDVVADTVKDGEHYRLYRFSAEEGSGKFSSIGFAASKNNSNICLFLDYVLSAVRDLRKFEIKKIKTNISHLAQTGKYNHYRDSIEKKFGVSLETVSDIPVSFRGRDGVSGSSAEIIVKDAYRKLITESPEISLEENILIPPIFIDSFIHDYENIISFSNYWNVINLPEKQSVILASVIKQIEKMADEAKIEFEFEKAMDFYHRIFLTAEDKDTNAEIRTGAMLKQAEIHYHLDNLQSSKELLLDCAMLSQRHNCPSKAAKAHYYLGMIEHLLSEKNKADGHFVMAIANYEKAGEAPVSFDYVQARVRKEMNAGLTGQAVGIIDDFIGKTSSGCLSSFAAKAWGLKGTALYMKGDFEGTEKCYLKQLEIAEEIMDHNEIALSLTCLVTLYVYLDSKTYAELCGLLDQIKDISHLTRKKNYAAESNFALGIYFYRKHEYEKAARHLEISLSGLKILNHSYKYFSNLYYLGRSLFFQEKFIRSAKVLKELASKDKSEFHLQTLNLLGMIYFKRENWRKSVFYFRKITTAEKGNDPEYFKAIAYKHLGIIYQTYRNDSKKALKYYIGAKKHFELYMENNPGFDISGHLDFLNEKIRTEM